MGSAMESVPVCKTMVSWDRAHVEETGGDSVQDDWLRGTVWVMAAMVLIKMNGRRMREDG